MDLRPLIGAGYLRQRGSILEAGGAAASARWPERADRKDAAFVEVEGGRVAKVVRDDRGEPRGAFVAEAGGYRLLANDHSLSLWRDEGAILDLTVPNASGARRVTLGGATPESVALAYERLNGDGTRVVWLTSVRVTSGSPSEWKVLPWRSLAPAMSPFLHVTEPGVLLTAFEPPVHDAEPSLLVARPSEAEESKVERVPLAGPGWRSRALGDVALVHEQWLAVAAVEAETGTKPPVCAKPASLPPPDRPPRDLDTAYWEGSQPGQGGIAVSSQGPAGSHTLILETGLEVIPGHLAQQSPTRVAVSFCTLRPDRCYLAVVSLDGGEGALCSTAPGAAPAPLALDGESLAWVENGLRTVQLNSSPSLKGLTLRRAQNQPVNAH